MVAKVSNRTQMASSEASRKGALINIEPTDYRLPITDHPYTPAQSVVLLTTYHLRRHFPIPTYLPREVHQQTDDEEKP